MYHNTINFKKKNDYQKRAKYILYFGNFFYGKGVDILIKAFSKIKKKIKLVLCGNQKTQNFKFKIKKIKNIKLINEYVSNNFMYDLFKKSEIVILPYRKTYEYGTSGVLLNAIQAYKKIIFPNIEPFKKIKSIYKIGKMFNVENPIDLRKKIISSLTSKNLNININNYNKYLNDTNSWEDIAKIIVEKK